MAKILIDANVVLRFLLQDNLEQKLLVDNFLRKSIESKTNLLLTEMIVAEIVFMMTKTYKIDRNIAIPVLIDFLNFEFIEIANKEIILNALELFCNTRLDYADCYLISFAKIENMEIFTFDKKLINRFNQ